MDGIQAEVLLTFWSQLAPPLFRMLSSAIRSSQLHPALNSVIISLLLKQGKDPADCSSYRPLSLMNSDVKLLAKVLARRLQLVIAKIVHPDQTGFISARYAADNMRRLLHIVNNDYSSSPPTALFSLDAEKAFDRLNWSFLWEILMAMGFGPTFIGMVKTLYSSPTACLLTNNTISQPFCIQRGARQGCPLSPLLFILSLEPLAAAIRSSVSCTPIVAYNTSHKISLYADDVLLYLGNVSSDLQYVLGLFREYERTSGYKINWDKSALLPLNSTCRSLPLPSFIPVVDSFRYLGITITTSIASITTLNFGRTLDGVKRSIHNWQSLSLSFQSRLATIKMNVLPRLNFLSAMLPLPPPSHFLKDVRSTVTSFLWNSRKPRIRYSFLTLSRDDGGLALPEYEWYHWSFVLRSVWHWLQPPPSPPSWFPIEENLARPHQLQHLPFLSLKAKAAKPVLGPIVSYAVQIFHRVEKRIGSVPVWHSSTPVFLNRALNIGGQPITNSQWISSGIHVLGDLFDDSGLLTFQALSSKFPIPPSSFFFFLQLRSVLRTCGISFSAPLPAHPLCKFVASLSKSNRPVSAMYVCLRDAGQVIPPVAHKWGDISSPSPLCWRTIFKNIKRASRNPNHQHVQFSFVHRLYCTPRLRFAMALDPDPLCKLCPLRALGTFLHMFWECPPVAALWHAVSSFLSDLLDVTVPCSPQSLLLLDFSLLSFSPSQQQMISLSSVAAKLLLVSRWKDPSRCTFIVWRASLYNLIMMELSAARINGASDVTINNWERNASLVQGYIEESTSPTVSG